MSLATQIAYGKDLALLERIDAACVRQAVYLVTKASPTDNEIAWRDAMLGQRYTDVSLIGRNRQYVVGQPEVYDAADATEAVITDAILMAIVPDLPNAIKP